VYADDIDDDNDEDDYTWWLMKQIKWNVTKNVRCIRLVVTWKQRIGQLLSGKYSVNTCSISTKKYS